ALGKILRAAAYLSCICSPARFSALQVQARIVAVSHAFHGVSTSAGDALLFPNPWLLRILARSFPSHPTAASEEVMVSLTLNGKPQQFDVPDDMPLLWVIRDIARLTGTKFGCGMAQCGACTVHLDGAPLRACVTPVSAV
ncbi:(2Fe-2S)-binding protein, partial [Streptomyces sp. CO7]